MGSPSMDHTGGWMQARLDLMRGDVWALANFRRKTLDWNQDKEHWQAGYIDRLLDALKGTEDRYGVDLLVIREALASAGVEEAGAPTRRWQEKTPHTKRVATLASRTLVDLPVGSVILLGSRQFEGAHEVAQKFASAHGGTYWVLAAETQNTATDADIEGWGEWTVISDGRH